MSFRSFLAGPDRFDESEFAPLEEPVERDGRLALYAINIPEAFGGGGLSALDTMLADSIMLTPEGVVLREVAPGVDLERDILARMDFEPIMPAPPRLMDASLFAGADAQAAVVAGLIARPVAPYSPRNSDPGAT